jgi:hypothetical protein
MDFIRRRQTSDLSGNPVTDEIPIITMNEVTELFQTEINNSETIQQIANIFSDFMTNPEPTRSYTIDSSNNSAMYRFDFSMF